MNKSKQLFKRAALILTAVTADGSRIYGNIEVKPQGENGNDKFGAEP